MDNQTDEFQDSTSNLSNTETELNSTQQGYIKAITKLVRSIERANNHIQLLTTAIDKKKPPRGLIPKISPKIPDTPGKFIIKWKGIQQDAGLHLTETLGEYWTDRSNDLSEALDPIKNKPRLETSPAQWTKVQDIIDNISRETTQELKRKKSTVKIDQGQQAQQLQKRQNTRRFKRSLTHNIINLSGYHLTPGETSLVSKGLNFISTPKKQHPTKLLQDVLLFDRKLRLKYYFHQDSTTEPIQLIEEDNTTNDILHPGCPPSGQDPFLESYRSTIIHNTLKEIKRKNNRKFKRNLRKNGKPSPHLDITETYLLNQQTKEEIL